MKVVTLDSRRRVSLAKYGKREHTRYEATVNADGVITLRPVDVVPMSTLAERIRRFASDTRVNSSPASRMIEAAKEAGL